MAHNYQIDEVQEIADVVGDSLKLSKEAAKTRKDMIISCGVKFMAETAKIVCYVNSSATIKKVVKLNENKVLLEASGNMCLEKESYN